MEFTVPPPGSSAYLLLCLGSWMTGASAAAYVVFGLDQRRAAAGLFRVPERTLLWIAGLGGWPGAKLAQWKLRHRARQYTFAGWLNAICLMQFLLITLALLPQRGLITAVDAIGSAIAGDVWLAEANPKARVFGPKVADNLALKGFPDP